MSDSADFKVLVEKAMRIEGRSHMRPVVEKELLHYDILYALDKEGLLDNLTFQGGTLLRLCYGAPRFSEDLDFAGGKEFSNLDLRNMKNCIEKYIGRRYAFDVSVKEPKQLALESVNQGIKVDKWQVSVTTTPGVRNLPKQKIKIEVINVPAYSRVPRTLQKNYNFLPDGYSDTFIMCETLDEIYADKIISLVNCQKYIRHRDIWDLRWIKQQGASINEAFIRRKVSDYNISDYLGRLDVMLEKLDSIIHGVEFSQQMSRFIPLDVQERTLKKEKFLDFLTIDITALLGKVKDLLDK